MSLSYNYGEEVSYSFGMLRPEDYEKLQAFSCGNDALDRFIHEDVIIKNARGFKVKNEDGLHFKIENIESKEIIGFVSLATSGIVNIVGRYIRTFPAVKIDVFAIDIRYQKMHYDKESEKNGNPDEHYYFSDEIMSIIISHIWDINNNYALVSYILLYADKEAKRFYRRNGFKDFEGDMLKENNQEINGNSPMYYEL